MNRSHYLMFILGLTVSLTATPSLISGMKSQFAFAQPSATDTSGKRPDMLFTVQDDIGFASLKAYGEDLPMLSL